jgi:hypothetical protein
MDFTVERYQHELTWLDALAVSARRTGRDHRTRAAATGSQVTALHDCVLVLAVAAAVGAMAAACQHGRVRR